MNSDYYLCYLSVGKTWCYTIDSTINMDVDEVDDENVVNNSVQPSAEKTNI